MSDTSMGEKISLTLTDEDGQDHDDFQAFKSHSRQKRGRMFDDQFMDFMKWFKADIHKTYSKKDFQRIEKRNLITLIVGYIAVIGAYVGLHSTLAPGAEWFWGPPLFAAAIYLCIKAEVMHMRTHSPVNLTGNERLDKAIDFLGLALSGVSPNLLKRRHLAAHYNDVGSASKLFSNVWLTFDKVPIIFYLRPYLLLKFLLDKEFCKTELIDRRTLLIETVGFYLYIGAFAFELLYLDSHFLLLYHLIPGLWVAGTQIIGAIIVHSGLTDINTFESCGLMDPKTAKGLFKVPLWWFGLFNASFFVNHSIHHAYPQVPLEIINANYERYYEHILTNYEGVRYNRVLNHHIHGNILDTLPAPGPLDYIVAFFITLLVHVTLVLVGLGLPIPPVLFELPLVDYRIYFNSTRYERSVNKIRFMESIELPERFEAIESPNTYLRYFHFKYTRLKAYVAAYERKHGLTPQG